MSHHVHGRAGNMSPRIPTKPPRRSVRHESHHACFACGVSGQRGLRLHFEVGGDGVAAAEWVPKHEFRSYPDRVHGGVVATLLDSAMVHALFARGITGVTAEITIRYLQAVSPDAPVRITGWVEGEPGRLHRCRAEVHQHGVMVVRASAKFLTLQPPKP